MAAILVLIECPKSIPSEVLVVLRPYQNVKSIRKAVFNLQGSQAISCLGYNVNLQTAVGAILVFVEYPKSLASHVLVILRSYQNMKSIQQAVFNVPPSQAIASEVLKVLRPYQNMKPIRQVAFKRPYLLFFSVLPAFMTYDINIIISILILDKYKFLIKVITLSTLTLKTCLSTNECCHDN